MSAPYTVSWADRGGPVGDSQHDTFEEALAAYRTRRAVRGQVAFIAGDGCEHDGDRWYDGLTEEEREQL